jgi:hypothetical protein
LRQSRLLRGRSRAFFRAVHLNVRTLKVKPVDIDSPIRLDRPFWVIYALIGLPSLFWIRTLFFDLPLITRIAGAILLPFLIAIVVYTSAMVISVFGLGLVALCGALWCVLNVRYSSALLALFGFALCWVTFSRLLRYRRGILERETREYSSSLERLPFSQACSIAEESCASVPHELAAIGGFPSPQGPGRFRYFEHSEVVFRIEEDRNGAARCIFKDSQNA